MLGSKNYVSILGDAFSKEYHAKSTSGHSVDLSNLTSQKFTDLLEKLIKIINSISISMRDKAKQMQDELLRQKADPQKKQQSL